MTESQLYKVIFRYLDIHRYKIVDVGKNIHFMELFGNEFSDITYVKEDKYCSIDMKLIRLVSDFFSLPDLKETRTIIGKWVEYTLQMEVRQVFPSNKDGLTDLRIEK